MNKLFEKLNQLSFSAVLFIASGLALVAILPLWIYIARQQTASMTRAVSQTSLAPTAKPTPTNGPVPANPPIITRVYPWVGKAGDVIIIDGKNFGRYPSNRRLSVGGIIIPDRSIVNWSDTQIETVIPQNPQQGMPVSLRIDTYPIVDSAPLVFYDEKATIRIRKQNDIISVSGITGSVNATLFTPGGKRETTATGTAQESVPLFTLAPAEEILSILLTDGKGTAMPYSIDPLEFGF